MPPQDQRLEALHKLLDPILAEQLRHGFGEIRITIEIIKGGRRAVNVVGGKSNRIVLSENPETGADDRDEETS